MPWRREEDALDPLPDRPHPHAVYPMDHGRRAGEGALEIQKNLRIQPEPMPPDPREQHSLVQDVMGDADVERGKQILGTMDPYHVPGEARNQIRQQPLTPVEQVTGFRYMGAGEEEEGGVLRQMGREFVRSLNPFEGDISARERAFRVANVGTLWLPWAWAARAPMLMRAFPSLRRATTTVRGQTAISAASEGALAGGLEIIRGPDEEGNQQIVANTLLGATMGGVLGRVFGATHREARRGVSREFARALEDPSRVARNDSPLFTEQWAMLAPGNPGFRPETNARIYQETLKKLGEFGLEPIPARVARRDALLVPGLDQDTAIDIARATDSAHLLTNKGYLDLERGVRFPMERGRSAVGQGVDPAQDFHAQLRLGGEKSLLFKPGLVREDPIPLELSGPRGEAVTKLSNAMDQSSRRSFPLRLWDRFRNVDMGSAIQTAYRKSLRETHGLSELMRRVGLDPENVPVRENVAKQAELLKARYSQFTESAILRGVPRWEKPIGKEAGRLKANFRAKGLKPLLEESVQPGEMPKFQEVGFARLLLERAREYGEKAIPLDATGRPLAKVEELEEIVRQAPTRWLDDEAQVGGLWDLVRWQNEVLEETLVNSGVLSREQYRAITRKDDGSLRFFIPALTPADAGRKALDDPDAPDLMALFDPIKKVGRGRESEQFVPPVEQIVRNTAMYARMADQQRLRNQVVRTVEENVMAGSEQGQRAMRLLGLEKLDAPPEELKGKGREVLGALAERDPALPRMAEQLGGVEEGVAAALDWSVPGRSISERRYVNRRNPQTGRMDWYQVTDDGIWEGLRSLEPTDFGALDGIIRAASAPAALLRTTVTQGFGFMAKNPVRDIPFAFVNVGLNPLMAIRGAANMLGLGQTGYREAWEAAGGPRAALVSLDRPHINRQIEQVRDRGPLRNVVDVANPVQWYRMLQGFSEGLEGMTRLGAFRQRFDQLVREGVDVQDAVLEAALQSKRASVNFSMTGSSNVAKGLRNVSTFWNAVVQGADQIRRSAQQDPVGFTLRGSVLTGASVGLYLANRQEGDEYTHGIPDWEKNLFWHFKMPEGSGIAPGEWMRIPKPFEPGVMFGSLPERFLESLDREDPRALDDGFRQAGENFGMGILPVPTVLQPVGSIWRNANMLTGAPVVPRGLEDVDPDHHGLLSQRPTALAQAMTDFLNQGEDNPQDKISPLVVQEMMSGMTGELAELVYADIPEALIDAYRFTVHGEDPDPRRRWREGGRRVPGAQTFYSSFPYSSQSVDDLYTLGEKARMAARTATVLEEAFEFDSYVDYIEERGQLLDFGPGIQRTIDDVRKLRDERDAMFQNPALSLDEKREQARRYTHLMHTLAAPVIQLVEETTPHRP